MPTREAVLKALGACLDPELGKDIVTLGMVQNLAVEGGAVRFDLVLTTPACPMRRQMEEGARQAALGVPGVTAVEVRVTAQVTRGVEARKGLPAGIKNVVAVGSGKGGVGKSSVASNLAVALALDGAKVGLLDADIYGPNQPQMFGVSDFAPQADSRNRILPAQAHGVKMFSMGFLLEPDSAAIWRGPMLHAAVRQFLEDVDWGELDYLVVDLPPGTGDVQLSLSQSIPIAGAVIVTTPQSIALSDVRKAVSMFHKVSVPILGIVENMCEFACPRCGAVSRIFSEGGAKDLAAKYGVPCLGSIPLDPRICRSGEDGTPMTLAHPDSPVSAAFRDIARKTAGRVSLQNQRRRQAESVMDSVLDRKQEG